MPDQKLRERLKAKRLKHVSFRAIVPNMITIMALSAGATAIRLGLDDRFGLAMLAIVIAGILDGLDGSIARLLKTPSKFGAELDSLSDVVSFGVAPAIVLYVWRLGDLKGLGWVLALALIVCCALRLARFNSKLEDDEEPRRKAGFLTGIPAPVGAALAIVPLMMFVEYGEGFYSTPWILGLYTALICLGMVSKLPTYSFRTMVIHRDYMVPMLAFVGLLVALITAYGWQVLIVAAAFYVLSIPVSVYRFYQITKTS